MISVIPKHRIIVGPDPGTVAKEDYNHIIAAIGDRRTHAISLNDFPTSAKIFGQYHWHPIHERGKWMYPSFYWFTHTMRRLLNTGDQVYVHCAMGVNRSRCFTFAHLVGTGMDDVLGADKALQGVASLFERNIREGYIPPKVLNFIKAVSLNPQHSLSLILDQ